MPNDTVRTREFRNGQQVGVTERELTDEEQAVKDRRQRHGLFRVNGNPSQNEVIQAVKDLMDEMGL